MVRRVRTPNIPKHILLEVSHMGEAVGADTDKLEDHLIIGASEGQEAHIGVSGDINSSKIVGATKHDKADIGLSDRMAHCVVIGAAEGKNAAVGWADETLRDSLIIGATRGDRGDIGHAELKLSGSMIIGSTTGSKDCIGFSVGMDNCLIIGTAGRGDVARAARIRNSVIIADAGEKRIGRAAELTDTLVLDIRQGTATHYDRIGSAKDVLKPKYRPSSRYLTRLGRTGADEVSDIQLEKIGELVSQLTGEGNIANRILAKDTGDRPNLFLEEVTSGEIRFTRNFRASYTDVQSVHGFEFEGMPIYRPGETITGCLQGLGMHKPLSCILSVPSVRRYVPLAIKSLLERPVFRKRVSVKEKFRRRWF